MPVLSRAEIEQRLNKPIRNSKSLVITPFLQRDDSFDADSVDLRLGTHFLMPQLPPEPFLDPTIEKVVKTPYLRIHIPLGRYLVLPAHQTVLGATLEFIKLPHDVAGEILTKSSVARTFMVIETAPWIHPEYRGCLTLEIANVSNTPILLYPGMPIAQMILLSVPQAKAQGKLSGTYLGPVYPEAPNLKRPRQVLSAMGVDNYRHPSGEWRRTESDLKIELEEPKGRRRKSRGGKHGR